MKKFLPIITGIVVGTAIGLSFVHADRSDFEANALNSWDETVASLEAFSWKDVFGGINPGKDLYKMVYYKQMIDPDKTALRDIAGNFGLTTQEARQVINGSIAPIFNDQDREGTILTREDAINAYQNIQSDFNELTEVYEIQQQIDLATTPSELFSNGDLSDSGFDLLFDLQTIEEILFVDKTAVSVGAPYSGALASPVLATDPDDTLGNFVSANDRRESSDVPVDSTVRTSTSPTDTRTMGLAGSEAVPVDFTIDESQICEVDTDVTNALETFEAQNNEVGDGLNTGGSGSQNDSDNSQNNAPATVEELKPATPDKWGGKVWCPGLGQLNESGELTGVAESFGDAGWESLGSVTSSLIDQAATAVAGYETGGFSARVALCVDTKLVFKRVRSYNPGQSCVACELDQINDDLNKTLYHSLIPNKVTGNYFESAKCKQSFEPLLDMQFITMAAPITTPPNDELIFGNDIFREWNDFVRQYQPFLGLEPTFDEEFQSQMLFKSAGEDTKRTDIVNQVRALRAQQTAEAGQDIFTTSLGNSSRGVMEYSQEVLGEMRQMTAFFESFNDKFQGISQQICPDIINKPDIQ